MVRAPRLNGKELIKQLQHHGFLVSRVRGSHHFLKHRDGHSRLWKRNHRLRAFEQNLP
ncbi:MAG: type II toxin-antitoxin system HicA family toxin [Alphaproteobacteria bacterium]|nr:type II toxin-antitoxin system HicA family toxin [Alphaproteobacteria bacterium]